MSLYEIFDPKARPQPIGIDLGTTHSLVAYVHNGKPECIADCNQQTLVPSVVYYGDLGVVVGEQARAMAVQFPKNTIASVKRWMGRGADDPEIQKLSSYDFASLEEAPNRRVVHFKIPQKNSTYRLATPIEISAEILKALRDRAKEELQTVGPAVITVPAYFDDAQRQATKDAAKMAGLEVLRLLNEPTAAALAYGLDQKKNGTFLVYDLGGGTFDVTVLKLEDGVFQVQSTGGDSALGGDDFDQALAEFFLHQLNQNSSIKTHELIREALHVARSVKHQLTDSTIVHWNLIGTTGKITREQFESLIRPIVERTVLPVRRALRDAHIRTSELDGVILVGGATRTPLVRSTVAQLLGKEPLANIDPDQVVALGAAIQADLLAGDQLSSRGHDILLLDVVPLSLGIETMGGIVDKIIPRNTTIPTAARATFTTYADRQTGFEIHVVQGEREMAEDNRSLARFTLKGIPPMPAGMARLEVTFKIDADGLLQVHAVETTTGKEQSIEVRPTYGLTDDELETMLIHALDSGEEDFLKRRLAEARVEAERILLATRKSIVDGSHLLEPNEQDRIQQALADLQNSISKENPNLIRLNIEQLDRVSAAFAGRRMNEAITHAIAGRNVHEVEHEVEHAKGVDAHVEEHMRGRV